MLSFHQIQYTLVRLTNFKDFGSNMATITANMAGSSGAGLRASDRNRDSDSLDSANLHEMEAELKTENEKNEDTENDTRDNP